MGTAHLGRWLVAGAVGIVIAATALGYSRHQPAGPLAKLDYTLKDMHGKDVRLADFKGRPILINFWDTSCGPCLEEMPAIVETFEKYKDRGLVVLGVSVFDSAAELQTFIPAHHVSYTILVGSGHDDFVEQYEALDGIPISWFIRKDGTVALKQPGYNSKAWFEEQIRALF